MYVRVFDENGAYRRFAVPDGTSQEEIAATLAQQGWTLAEEIDLGVGTPGQMAADRAGVPSEEPELPKEERSKEAPPNRFEEMARRRTEGEFGGEDPQADSAGFLNRDENDWLADSATEHERTYVPTSEYGPHFEDRPTNLTQQHFDRVRMIDSAARGGIPELVDAAGGHLGLWEPTSAEAIARARRDSPMSSAVGETSAGLAAAAVSGGTVGQSAANLATRTAGSARGAVAQGLVEGGVQAGENVVAGMGARVHQGDDLLDAAIGAGGQAYDPATLEGVLNIGTTALGVGGGVLRANTPQGSRGWANPAATTTARATGIGVGGKPREGTYRPRDIEAIERFHLENVEAGRVSPSADPREAYQYYQSEATGGFDGPQAQASQARMDAAYQELAQADFNLQQASRPPELEAYPPERPSARLYAEAEQLQVQADLARQRAQQLETLALQRGYDPQIEAASARAGAADESLGFAQNQLGRNAQAAAANQAITEHELGPRFLESGPVYGYRDMGAVPRDANIARRLRERHEPPLRALSGPPNETFPRGTEGYAPSEGLTPPPHVQAAYDHMARRAPEDPSVTQAGQPEALPPGSGGTPEEVAESARAYEEFVAGVEARRANRYGGVVRAWQDTPSHEAWNSFDFVPDRHLGNPNFKGSDRVQTTQPTGAPDVDADNPLGNMGLVVDPATGMPLVRYGYRDAYMPQTHTWPDRSGQTAVTPTWDEASRLGGDYADSLRQAEDAQVALQRLLAGRDVEAGALRGAHAAENARAADMRQQIGERGFPQENLSAERVRQAGEQLDVAARNQQRMAEYEQGFNAALDRRLAGAPELGGAMRQQSLSDSMDRATYRGWSPETDSDGNVVLSPGGAHWWMRPIHAAERASAPTSFRAYQAGQRLGLLRPGGAQTGATLHHTFGHAIGTSGTSEERGSTISEDQLREFDALLGDQETPTLESFDKLLFEEIE